MLYKQSSAQAPAASARILRTARRQHHSCTRTCAHTHARAPSPSARDAPTGLRRLHLCSRSQLQRHQSTLRETPARQLPRLPTCGQHHRTVSIQSTSCSVHGPALDVRLCWRHGSLSRRCHGEPAPNCCCFCHGCCCLCRSLATTTAAASTTASAAGTAAAGRWNGTGESAEIVVAVLSRKNS